MAKVIKAKKRSTKSAKRKASPKKRAKAKQHTVKSYPRKTKSGKIVRVKGSVRNKGSVKKPQKREDKTSSVDVNKHTREFYDVMKNKAAFEKKLESLKNKKAFSNKDVYDIAHKTTGYHRVKFKTRKQALDTITFHRHALLRYAYQDRVLQALNK